MSHKLIDEIDNFYFQSGNVMAWKDIDLNISPTEMKKHVSLPDIYTYLNENYVILISPTKFVPKGSIDNKPVLVPVRH